MSLENALIRMASENPELAEDVIEILAAADDEGYDSDEDFYAEEDEDEDFYAEEDEIEDEDVDLVEAMLHLAAEGGSGAKRPKRDSSYDDEIHEVAKARHSANKGARSAKAKAGFARLLTAFRMETDDTFREAVEALKNFPKLDIGNKEQPGADYKAFKAWLAKISGVKKKKQNAEAIADFKTVYGRKPSGAQELRGFKSMRTRLTNKKPSAARKLDRKNRSTKMKQQYNESIGGRENRRTKKASLAEILGY